ncbi:hypothetical protein AXG93_4142s1070 [Marchantia polymorpha subsp. ruderalis]|uniref:non-specific serine/threonine protein kinase n=1 Tax=Marchantia polymorpha subsp. ruderalis TaxID=1480154 RepID=A0A176WP08_MARPO|nr:hypothetical protein AXG93_4142s1070 [Marchantia polymorpha subsp. ruderalis]
MGVQELRHCSNPTRPAMGWSRSGLVQDLSQQCRLSSSISSGERVRDDAAAGRGKEMRIVLLQVVALPGNNMRSALLSLAVAFLVLSSCCVAAFPRNIGVPVPYAAEVVVQHEVESEFDRSPPQTQTQQQRLEREAGGGGGGGGEWGPARRRLLLRGEEDCTNSRGSDPDPSASQYLPYDTSSSAEAQILMSLKSGLNDAASNALANWNFTHVVSINLAGRKLGGYISAGLSGLPLLATLDIVPAFGRSTPILGSLNLMKNKLSGGIPASLGECLELTSLDLRRNRLRGTIPYDLGALTKLQLLYLNNNKLDGAMPITGFIPDDFKALTNLEGLYLYGNFMTGPLPDWLASLPRLSYLHFSPDLYEIDLSLDGEIPASLSGCPELVTVALSGNNLTGPIFELDQLVNLRRLSLEENFLTGSIPDSVTNLSTLGLSHNNLSGLVPASLVQCTALEWLGLADNNLTGQLPEDLGSLPQDLGNLTNLQYLNLERNSFEGPIPESLGNLLQLQSLSVLYLQGNRLSGSIPLSLSNLTSLQDLALGDNELEGGIPAALLRGLAGLVANFSLGQNRLSGPIPDEIGLLSMVKSINLARNELNESIPESIGNCSALLRLDLSSNRLSGALPSSLGNLSKLEVLNVSHNEIDGDIPSELGKLGSLVDLDLSVNNVSGPIPQSLTSLQNLAFLNVSDNNLSGEVMMLGAFQHLSAASFLGNPGLCGAILQRKCNEAPAPYGSSGGKSGHNRGSIIARSELFYPQLRFTAQDLKLATENFSEVNILGVGCMSQVYRGVLPELVLVAIKKLKIPSGKDIPSGFVHELDELGRLRHKHLVAVLGYCFDSDLNALVVQFMSNGSLEEHLHRGKTCDLDWAARVKIAVGVAKALTYLHHECGSTIVHCDLKPSNILLDAEFEPHLEDFGLSRLIFAHKLIDMSDSSLGNSVGYFPPEMWSPSESSSDIAAASEQFKKYGFSATVSPKGDVYSYGITLLEMLTGKRPSGDMFGNEMTIRKWCQASYPERTQDILDPNLLAPKVGTSGSGLTGSNLKQINLFMKVALMCTREIPEERPTMRHVVDMLR